MCELQHIIYTQRLVLHNSEVISLRNYVRKNNGQPLSPRLPSFGTCDFVRLLGKEKVVNEIKDC